MVVVMCVQKKWSVSPIYLHNSPSDESKLVLYSVNKVIERHMHLPKILPKTTRQWHGPILFMRIYILLTSQQLFFFATASYVPTC